MAVFRGYDDPFKTVAQVGHWHKLTGRAVSHLIGKQKEGVMYSQSDALEEEKQHFQKTPTDQECCRDEYQAEHNITSGNINQAQEEE